MLLLSILALSAPIVAPLHAEAPARQAVVPPPEGQCLPTTLFRGARVVALSVYSAQGTGMPFRLAGSNYPVRALTVTGRGKDPIVLVVSAYQPVLWKLDGVRDRVRAVVASGYYPQALSGLATETPVRFSSAVGTFNGAETCGRVRYAYDQIDDIQGMADDIKRATGVGPRMFFGRYSTERLDVDDRTPGPPDAPDLSAIRAAVPLVTQDDPESRAVMKVLPADSPGARVRFVEWDDAGSVVRDEGNREMRREGGSRERRARSSIEAGTMRAQRSGGGGFWSMTVLLALLGASIWLCRNLVKRSKANAADAETPPRRIPSVPAETAVPPAPRGRYAGALAELSAIAGITDSEALVVVLHRFGKELQGLTRTRFETDLDDEITAIVDRHFWHAVARYREVRPGLSGGEAERADKALTQAFDRLAARLEELRDAQHRRDVASVDAAARFIDARHPA